MLQLWLLARLRVAAQCLAGYCGYTPGLVLVYKAGNVGFPDEQQEDQLVEPCLTLICAQRINACFLVCLS